MKNINKKITGLFVTGLLVFSSCADLDINRDPDLLAPEQVPMSSELPGAITGIVATQGSAYAIAGGMWSQFWTQSAVANQYKTLDDYSIPNSAGMVSGAWRNMFDALTDIRNIKKNAEATNNWNYYLIATCLEVYSSQILVDMFGTIPYTEANNTAILNPAFESGEVVYDNMVLDLQDALSRDLSASPFDNAPGSSDFIFGGNMDSWTRFANTLLLKVYLRQSEARTSVAQAGITSLINSGAQFLTEDAAVTQFSDEASKRNPLYENEREQLNVGTNLRASVTLGSFLQNGADPRLPFVYDGTNFQIQGNYNDGLPTSSVIIMAYDDPVFFISAAESYFLQAEAAVRYMSGANAEVLYGLGVEAAFDRYGLDGSGLLAGLYAYPNGSDDENIKAIITQKWVSLFPGNGYESFIEQNRTGFPEISGVAQDDASYVPGELSYSVEGRTGGLFPKRFLYPLDEHQRNTNAPAPSVITDAVWYDVN